MDLLERVQRLEDVEAIGRLKTLYCEYCDASFDAEAVASLFTEDGVWDGGKLRGRKIGRRAIRDQFDLTQDRIPFAAHLLSNQQIDIDGDTGRGKWRMLMPFNMNEDGETGARWQVSAYDDAFARVGGVWRFTLLTVRLTRLDAARGAWVPIDN